MKTNKERYKQAFSNLQMPKPVDLKEETMNKKTKMILRPAIAFSLAALLLGGSALAYATDAGGIRTKVNGWFGGQERNVEAVSNGDIGYEFYDPENGEYIGGGGGVSFYAFGNEIPMDAQEVFDQYSTQIEKKEDKYFLHLYENSYEITDLLHPGKTIYVQGKGNGIIHYAKITLDPDGNISSSISTEPEIEADSYQKLQ